MQHKQTLLQKKKLVKYLDVRIQALNLSIDQLKIKHFDFLIQSLKDEYL